MQPNKLNSVDMPLDGVVLIEAAAGTGKTYNIQNIVARYIVEKNFAIETLAVVTFTDKAAKELADRMRKMLVLLTGVLNDRSSAKESEQQRARELLERFSQLDIPLEIQKERLENALSNIDNCRVSTIHGFCFRLLSEYAFESSVAFKIKLEKNIKVLIEKFLKDFCRSKRYSSTDLPGWFDLTPQELFGDVKDLLSRHNAKLEYHRPPFADEEAIGLRLRQLQNEFLELPGKTAAITFLLNKLNKIDSLLGNDHVMAAIAALANIEKFSPGDWRSWYEAIKLFRISIFQDKGKVFRKKSVPDNWELVNEHIAREKIFSIAEEYCLTVENDCKVFLLTEAVKFIRKNLEQWKLRENCFDYLDLLIQADRALQDLNFRKFVQKKLNVGIIDEFQDTDPLQYNIFKAIFMDRPEKRLIMVGDPRQAIYSFRGGDMETYLTARKECIENQGNIYTLTTNFRSSGAMIDAFNMIFDHKDPFFTDEIVFEEVVKPTNVLQGIKYCDQEIKCPMAVDYLPVCKQDEVFALCAEEIAGMVASGKFTIPDENGVYRKITPGDIAVLTAENRFLEDIRHHLEQYNIPTVGERPGGVWNSKEAKELAKFMQAVLENNNSALVREALMTNICNVPLTELDSEAVDADEKMLAWRLDFIALSECWHENGTASFIVMMLKMFSLKEKLTATAGGDRTLSNYIHLGDLLAAAEFAEKLSPLGVLKFFNDKIASSNDEDYEMLESDRAAVHLITIHKAKGLQFPIVFLPQLSARRPLAKKGMKFYHKNKELCCNIDKLDKQAEIAAGVEEMQEIMRLVYVAITRSCYFCRISWNKGSMERTNPMTWLFAWRTVPPGTLYRQDYVSGNINLNSGCINIPIPMQHDDLFCQLYAETYIPQINENIIEPEPVRSPSSNRYIISYSALNEINSQSENLPDPESFTDRDDNDEAFYPDIDDTNDLQGVAENDKVQQKLSGGIWDIPHGAAVGNAWHEILEKTDFTSGIDWDLLKNTMANYGFSEPEHLANSAEMFRRLLDHQLPCGMKLSELTSDRRITELEFLLSSPDGFTYSAVIDAVNEYMRAEFNSAITAKGFLNMPRGFFTGFVDMIFEYKNKLYIVDWKSNALGCFKESFSAGELKKQMFKKFYPLQYLCYLAALLKYLEQRLQRNVDETLYNEYVGGVYYIFLRGMMLDEPAGVFSAKVPYKTVRALANVITCGKGE